MEMLRQSLTPGTPHTVFKNGKFRPLFALILREFGVSGAGSDSEHSEKVRQKAALTESLGGWVAA